MARVNKTKPYGKTTWRGMTFDNRTVSALQWAEARYRKAAPGKRAPWRFGQGSYSHSSLSANTHAGGGAADIMFSGLNAKQRRATVKWLRRAGFAAWSRTGPAWGANGANDHCHAILLGHRTASPEAKWQMTSYLAHRDGLAGNAYDPTPRPPKRRRWSHRRNRPIIK